MTDTTDPTPARAALIAYAASTRTVTADGLDPLIDAAIAEAAPAVSPPPATDRAASYRLAADAIESMQGYPHLILPEEIVAGLRLLATGAQPEPGSPAYTRRPAAGGRDEQQAQQGGAQARGPRGTVPGCTCPHPSDEHSIYGCADGCGCEWMPKRRKRPPMDPVHILGIEADEPDACTCGSAGDAFVPAGHYADCPCPEARQQHGPAAAPVAGQPPADRLHCPRCQEDITDYAEDDFVFRTGDERPYCSGECVVAAHRAGLPTEQPPADTGEEQPRFVRVCIACPECDHTLDENGACANGCTTPPAVVAEPGKENSRG